MARTDRLILVDTKTQVAVRIMKYGRRAVPMTPVEFAVFMKLRDNRKVTTAALLDEIYNGVKEPPLNPRSVLTAIVVRLNRKLAHIGVSIATDQRGKHTTRRLIRA